MIIAKSIGQGDNAKIGKAVHTSVIVALLGGLFVTVLGELFAPGIVQMLDVPGEVYPLSLGVTAVVILVVTLLVKPSRRL